MSHRQSPSTSSWSEINAGSDIKVPIVFRYVIQYVTPLFLGFVFVASLPGIWAKIIDTNVTWHVHAARVLLVLLFLGISWFVRIAYLKRKAQYNTAKP